MQSPYVISDLFVQLCSHLCGGFVDESSHFPGEGRLGGVWRGRAFPFTASRQHVCITATHMQTHSEYTWCHSDYV